MAGMFDNWVEPTSREENLAREQFSLQQAEGLSPEQEAIANFAKVRSGYFKSADWDEIIKGIKSIVPKEYDFKADIDSPEKFRKWWEELEPKERVALKKSIDSKLGTGTYNDLANAMTTRFTNMDRENVLNHPIGIPVLDQIASSAIKIFTPNQAKAIREGGDYTGGEMAEDLVKDLAYAIPVGGAGLGAKAGLALGSKIGASTIGKVAGAGIGGTIGNAVVPTGVEIWDAYDENRPISGENIAIGTAVNEFTPFLMKGLIGRFGQGKAYSILQALQSGKQLNKTELEAVNELVQQAKKGTVENVARRAQELEQATQFSGATRELVEKGVQPTLTKAGDANARLYYITDPKTGRQIPISDDVGMVGFKYEAPKVEGVSPAQQASLDYQWQRTRANMPTKQEAKELYKQTAAGVTGRMSFEEWYNELANAVNAHNKEAANYLFDDIAGSALGSYITNRFGDSDIAQDRANRRVDLLNNIFWSK